MRAAAAQHGVAGTTSCGTQADEVVACDKRVKLVVHKEAFDGCGSRRGRRLGLSRGRPRAAPRCRAPARRPRLHRLPAPLAGAGAGRDTPLVLRCRRAP